MLDEPSYLADKTIMDYPTHIYTLFLWPSHTYIYLLTSIIIHALKNVVVLTAYNALKGLLLGGDGFNVNIRVQLMQRLLKSQASHAPLVCCCSVVW